MSLPSDPAPEPRDRPLGEHTDGTLCVRPGTGCNQRGCPPPERETTVKTDPILTAEQFDRECRRREARRVHQLAEASQRLDADIRSQRIWATVVALVFLGVLALIGFIVHAVTSEHASEHRHQISVYCYADPNSNRSTSEATGSPVDLATFCPDHR